MREIGFIDKKVIEKGKCMSYKDIVKHYEDCFRLHGNSSQGVDWPNKEDAETRYKVMLEVIDFNRVSKSKNEKVSILDFGCGLGHLYDYIKRKGLDIDYTGADISNVFIEECKKAHPNKKFFCIDILKNTAKIDEQYDYIIINGVFTEKQKLTFNEMFSYVKLMLPKLYQMCRCGLAFNVMSKDVDWERDDLFHLSLSDLSFFLTKNLTRDFVIRYDYGLYEYTTYVYKRTVDISQWGQK